MPDGKVEFDVVGNNRGIKTSIDEATQYISQETKKWEKDAKNAGDGIQSAISGALKNLVKGFSLAAAGKALFDLGKDAIGLASDLEEVQNVVDVTFGKNNNQIETWAKNAGDQFGLTELQAKKFTSTLGAMMKSAGLAGPEIVSMSTDLAGLAADMASFYNLDFDTAFQKIRSGISGETEPLKQLGINMSVANLEAFALAKGLKKSFDEMSQGEQMMLRYQYMMQTTADAQGDFARTSDGFANSVRSLETAFDELKGKLGTPLIKAASLAVDAINKVVDAVSGLFPEERRTILDDIADIDLDLQKKIDDINATATKANELVEVMGNISASPAGEAIKNMATGANSLKANSYTNWENILDALKDADVKLPKRDAADGITALAGALSGAVAGEDKAKAWKDFFTDLANSAEQVSKLTDMSVDDTREWLLDIANAAGSLDPNDADAWDDLFTTVINKMPGLKDLSGIPLLLSLDTVAQGANALKENSYKNWEKVLSALHNADGLQNILGDGNVTNNLKDFADALSGAPGLEDNKAEAWRKLVDILKDNVEAVAKLTGKDVNETSAWLDDIAASAAKLDPMDVRGWDDLFTAFAEGLPNLTDLDGADIIKTLASTAPDLNTLNASSPGIWRGVLSSLKSIDGLQNIFGNNDNATKNISELAEALSGNGLNMSKADAWEKLLNALSDNADAVSTLTGEDAEGTGAWLHELAKAAGELKPDDVAGWDKLFTLLLSGLSGTEDGEKFINGIAAELLAMGTESKVALDALRSLGFSSEDIDNKQREWLETCRQLVATIPGLNKIINTETGEVEGGIQAIEDYVTAWQQGQVKLAYLQAVERKRAALNDAFAELPTYKINMQVAKDRLKKAYNELSEYYKSIGGGEIEFARDDGITPLYTLNMTPEQQAQFEQLALNYINVAKAEQKAREELETMQQAYDEGAKDVDEFETAAHKLADGLAEVSTASVETARVLNDEEKKALQELTKNTKDALAELASYYESVFNETQKSVESTVSGLDGIETATMKAATMSKELGTKIIELEKEKAQLNPNDKKDEEAIAKIDSQIAKLKAQQEEAGKLSGEKTAGDIFQNLQQQINYIDQYMKYLDQAKRLGVDKDLLAELSDGSQASYEYLAALAAAGDSEITSINEKYKEARKKRDSMSKTLTDTKISADEKYDELAQKADTFVKSLNKEAEAFGFSASTIEGIAKGISSKEPAVSDAVDGIIAEINRLDGLGIDITDGNGFRIKMTVPDGEYATGLNWVPFDGFLASLHEGEGILTAEENRIWQRFKAGSAATGTDYEALGGVMRDNIKPGGNVYLDGRTVGRVISDMQGKSYRTLERSGWQQ